MNILIDTDILLSIETDHMIQRHLQEVVRFINDLNYRIVIHPLTVKEVENDQDIPNKIILLSKIKKYSLLETRSNPYDDDGFLKVTGKPTSERDKVDAFLLYCLYKNEVDFFLTEDPDIINKAALLNISDIKIMDIKNAFNHFKSIMQKKVKRGNGPEYFFYQEGDLWHIGEKDAVHTFIYMLGFEYIRHLIDKVHQRISCLELYNAVNGSYVEKENKSNFGENEDEDVDDLYGSRKKRDLTPKTIQFLKKNLDTLMKELSGPGILSIEDREEKEKQARKLKKYLQEQERPSKDIDPNIEKARSGVTNAINRALNKISNKCTSSFLNHLTATIKTGSECFYNPLPNDEPSWNIDPKK